MFAREISEDEEQGREALLPIDELPRAVIPAFHDDWLQVVGRTVALPNVVQELSDLLLTPPVPALISGNERVPAISPTGTVLE